MPIRHKHAPVDDAPPPDLHDEPTGAMVIPVQFIQVNTRRPRRVAVQALPRGLIGLAEVLAVALAVVGLAVASGAARLADGEAAWAIRLVAAAGPGSAPLGTDRSHGLMTALLTGWASMTGA